MGKINFKNIKSVIYWLLILAGSVYVLSIRRPHIPEFAHYYMGAKYHREIGYKGIYDAYVKALSELYGEQFVLKNIYAVRNLHGTGYIKPEQSLAYFSTQKWSSKRWRSFLNDTRFLTQKLAENPRKSPIGHWATILIDHGYNPTPVYTSYVNIITNIIPLNQHTINILCAFDVIFIILIFLLIYKTSGLDALLFSFIYFISAKDMLTYCTWGLFRFDWMFAVALSFYFMKRNKYFMAGILWAISASIRIFPMYMAFFTIAVWLISYKNNKDYLQKLFKYTSGLIIGGISILALSIILLYLEKMNPIDVYRQFLFRISWHAAEVEIFNAIGLDKLFEALNIAKGETVIGLLLGIALTICLGFYLIKSREKPDNIGILSMLFVPFFFYLSHYYYLMLTLLPISKKKFTYILMILLTLVNIFTTLGVHYSKKYYQIINTECVVYSAILIILPLVLCGGNLIKSNKN